MCMLETRFAERWAPAFLAVLGFVAFLAMLEIVGRYHLAGSTWPALFDVFAYMALPSHQALLLRAMSSTGFTVVVAYSAGSAAAVAMAVLVHVMPVLRPGLDRLAAFANAIPPVAVAPVFIILTSSFIAGVSLAALFVFFTIYIAATSGFDQVSSAHRDLFKVLGATPAKRMLHLDSFSALPSLFSGFKQAVSPAMVGVILSEWFAGEGGVGLLLISAMRNLQVPLLWAAMLVAAAMTLVLFAIGGLAERFAHRQFGR